MTEYKITCQDDPSDRIKAVGTVGEHVAFYPYGSDSVYVSPADARTFARGILALADEVDGGEAPMPTEPAVRDIKVGDRVRILRPEGCLPEYAGRVGVLTRTDSTECKYRVRVDEADDNIVWAYEVAPVDTDNAEQLCAKNARMDILEQARALVGSRDVPNLLAVARFLAGDNA
ncbi:hypothetical protein [Streptomyces sp. ITFR-6]|uniref:hypothetical protein n=1 Tax=Streptomyces sp. ITFR-6 TaxID=3075197 RepID=UPI0028897170|nr:hypothetical protein [Streptomyces sp. ITFR-6]WNI28608.1 hypothetical protein RLT59_07280 [Streptomyces sp. ITFR-6]